MTKVAAEVAGEDAHGTSPVRTCQSCLISDSFLKHSWGSNSVLSTMCYFCNGKNPSPLVETLGD